MAYVPPHKRYSKDSPTPDPSPLPPSVLPQSKRTLTLSDPKPNSRRRRDHQSSSNQGLKIIYAADSIARWFVAGSAGDDPIPSSVAIWEPFEWRNGGKATVIEAGEGGVVEERPWANISERVMPDLIGCCRAAVEGSVSKREVVKLTFVARTGKVLFLGTSVNLESIRKAAVSEIDSRTQVRKSFYTNVPSDYMEDMQNMLSGDSGFDFDSEKEYYNVKIFDKFQPESTISCKCAVVNDGALEIRKIELNQVRHLVVDISCLFKDLDLRLMLATKRILKSLDDEENEAINKLVKSAIIDPDVKGGLRWPLGEESVADRFCIIGVWHTKFKAFKNQSTRIKLRHADRFDHRTSTGEASNEVMLKLIGISKHLRDGNVELDCINDMVQESVKLIWDRFLSYSHSST
ncbi:uncharacterized protein A4U43_C09F11580 [Asparagus officinalis]|uniref:DUF7903 domain-containing protein n=1 Tax=Asparagus officinalis TaxID=4686 RepID=A0A5P1E8V3_ASPOF|nr:uncharacterized protein LOC109824045 [Asparagus officinalis]ONK58373.1 uncharacterized protein A4U43_C09F11580 [Asparagus officinalis]